VTLPEYLQSFLSILAAAAGWGAQPRALCPSLAAEELSWGELTPVALSA